VLGSFTERHLFVLGIIFILFVRFLPGGLFSLLRHPAGRERAP
jgi:ABC-type branched-subunit amino acid transport system permease subunit